MGRADKIKAALHNVKHSTASELFSQYLVPAAQTLLEGFVYRNPAAAIDRTQRAARAAYKAQSDAKKYEANSLKKYGTEKAAHKTRYENYAKKLYGSKVEYF